MAVEVLAEHHATFARKGEALEHGHCRHGLEVFESLDASHVETRLETHLHEFFRLADVMRLKHVDTVEFVVIFDDLSLGLRDCHLALHLEGVLAAVVLDPVESVDGDAAEFLDHRAGGTHLGLGLALDCTLKGRGTKS